MEPEKYYDNYFSNRPAPSYLQQRQQTHQEVRYQAQTSSQGFSMKKQENPTELQNRAPPSQYQPQQYQNPIYGGYPGSGAQPQFQVQSSQPLYQEPPKSLSPNPSKSPAVPQVEKTKVDAKTTIPNPGNASSLMKIFANDTQKFEEYLQAKIESLLAKKIHDKLSPFKVEIGSLIEDLGKANLEKSKCTGNQVDKIESSLKDQNKNFEELTDKFQVLSSQVKLLESSGIKSSQMEEQMTNMEKVRENIRAEVNLLINQRLKEEVAAMEEKLSKKVEDVEAKNTAQEKRIDTIKSENDELKKDEVELTAKLNDLSKLVTQLTVSLPKESAPKEELNKLKLSVSNLTKYREEDLKKVDNVSAVVEENNKGLNNKMESLEKFVLNIKKEKDDQAAHPSPQNSFEVSAKMQEELKLARNNTEHLSYKMDTIKYDLDLIKEDIVRQKRTQTSFFEKVDRMEKKVDSIPLGNASKLLSHSGTNFMSNASKVVDDSRNNNDYHFASNRYHGNEDNLNKTPKSDSTSMGSHNQNEKLMKNYLTEDDLDKDFDNLRTNNFSIIGGGGESLLEDDIFISNHNAKLTPSVQWGTSEPINAQHQAQNPSSKLSNYTIPEATKEEEASKSHIISQPPISSEKSMPPMATAQGIPQPQPSTHFGVNSFASPPPQPISAASILSSTASPAPASAPPHQPSQPLPSAFPPTSPNPQPTPPSSHPRPSDTSLLNQSLNTSIRVQKSVLRQLNDSVNRSILGQAAQPGSEAKNNDNDDSSIVEVNMDENGFLIDANGYPILNDKGEPMKLGDDDIDFLKENGLYEEEIVGGEEQQD